MSDRRGLLELTVGVVLRFDGLDWTVQEIQAEHGRFLVRPASGAVESRTFRWLMFHPDCRVVSSVVVKDPRSGQLAVRTDLTSEQQDRLHIRLAHALEAETGFRSGDSRRRAPGEPRPAYDPEQTTLTQRRRTKVAELAALGAEELAVLGLANLSERTLRRLAAAWRTEGFAGCVDGRWLRAGGGHPSINEPVREAIFAVRAESLHRSRMSMRAKDRLIHQYVLEKHGAEVRIPSYDTLRAVWSEWFGPGGARQRYVRSAAAVDTGITYVVVHRPGQVVALDTTVLPVKVRETVFGESVSVHLSLALDVYTHSLVAFRLTLVSDTSVDIAMVLRDVMMPLPMRDGWGEDMEWPYPGVPAAVVAEFAGHRVAGLPFFTPETVTTDHGSVYKNHRLVQAERDLGCNILPARIMRPTDKQAVERTFGGIRSLLFEVLPGYTGVDVADRGVDPESDAILTISQMEHLIATWIVQVWQNRALGEYAPAWAPGEQHSPNTLFAAAMAQGGVSLQIPDPQLYYRLLKPHYVDIHGRRGVKISGLWYWGPALPDGSQPSTRGGKHKGKWLIRSDRRDRRMVFFQDENTSEWHTLRWNGLPPEGEVPAFSSITADELLRQVRRRGLSPHSDAELLPVLLELLGADIPVDAWSTRMSKTQRTSTARQAAQGDAARNDRDPAPADDNQGKVVALRWPEQARSTEDSVTTERRHRREQAVPTRPRPPGRLGERLRRTSLLVLPDENEQDHAVETGLEDVN
ncbi:hypothetical protein [Nocardia sp. bgisy134]|uniref:hypothetical protein n=1 Tax=unclassified Nocardia TaxID=2637762 RepID=UPI003D74A876